MALKIEKQFEMKDNTRKKTVQTGQIVIPDQKLLLLGRGIFVQTPFSHYFKNKSENLYAKPLAYLLHLFGHDKNFTSKMICNKESTRMQFIKNNRSSPHTQFTG